MFKLIKNWVLDVLFPTPDLPQNLKLNQTLFCPVCRARLARNVKICHKNSQYKLGAAVSYNDEAVRKMIWQLKYRGRTGNAAVLGKILNTYFENLNLKIKNYVIVPVPLSKTRLRKRGYNQAMLIAKILSESLKFPVVENSLIRVKDTPPQAEVKDWYVRKENIQNCFGVADPALVKNKNIILVDDVFTSGATLNEIARVLKNAGARKILGLVIAKAG